MRIQCLDCKAVLEVDNEDDIKKNHWHKINDNLYCCQHCDVTMIDNITRKAKIDDAKI